MELYCAIDLRDGEAVRLVQGDFERQHRFGDAVELAERFVDAGARRLHVVDLDAARTGRAHNRAVIRSIVERVAVPVQVGGGVRRFDDVSDLIDVGVHTVVVGTVALEAPEVALGWARAFPDRLVLGLDYRRAGTRLEAAGAGWTEQSGRSVGEALEWWSGQPIAAVAVTAIDRDGTGRGPDTAGLAAVLELTEHPVIASGGVGRIEDLEELTELRGPAGQALAGAIVGMALVNGAMDVSEALAACTTSG
jgi:phosphoribosylformimino-5-aminoimidazole carboxamide ribotide isomerase